MGQVQPRERQEFPSAPAKPSQLAAALQWRTIQDRQAQTAGTPFGLGKAQTAATFRLATVHTRAAISWLFPKATPGSWRL